MKALPTLALLVAATALVACSSVGIGIGIPIPGVGGVSVGVDSSGRVGGGVAVGTGGVSVGVGGSGQLPPRTPERPASAPQPVMSSPR
jgi:hypothetical protein